MLTFNFVDSNEMYVEPVLLIFFCFCLILDIAQRTASKCQVQGCGQRWKARAAGVHVVDVFIAKVRFKIEKPLSQTQQQPASIAHL